MNIFFPNVGRRCELVDCFRKALPRLSPGLVWGSDPDFLAPALCVVDKVVTLPADFESQLFLDSLIDFLKREKINLIIPTIDPDLLRFNKWRAQIESSVPNLVLLISPKSVIKSVSNKIVSREVIRAMGLPVPEPVTHPIETDFPLFIKPALGSGSKGARVVRSLEEMKDALANTEYPVVERIVEGDEITVDVLLDLRGAAICAVPRRRLKVRDGEVVKAVIERDENLESMAMEIAESLNCIGPVTVQFRNPSPGEWVFMEVNARMGGGLPLTIMAGVDWPEAIIRMAMGEKGETLHPSSAASGLIMTRYDQSFFLKKKMLNNQNSGLIKRLPKLIIFDLDDTLFPERDFVRGGYRAASMLVWEDFGIEIENDLNKKFNQGLRGDLFTSVLLERNVEFDREYVPNRIVPAYRSHKPNIQTFLDVIPFLTALREVGHKLALISDGWFSVQKNKFTALKLECFFDEVLFTDEFGRENWKPSLQPFLRVCEKTCIDPTRAMYIGDNPFKDFIAPNKLGMESVRIRRSGLEHTPYESVKKNACAKQEISSFTDFHHLVSF